MNIKLKINEKITQISCGKKTCSYKKGRCKYLGTWAFHKSIESPFCCELLKIHGIKPHPLDCYHNRPYRICSIFAVR